MDGVIAISREYGSGGRLIAEKLSGQLDIPLYDREIISQTALKSGLAESFVENMQEVKPSSLLYSLYLETGTQALYDRLFQAQSAVIREMADKPCIILGRCADYVLRQRKNCIKVFVHAPMEERIRRLRDEYGVTEKNIDDIIIKQDKKRAQYYSHFTLTTWGKAQNYDLCVNSALGIDTAVAVIKTLYVERNQ